MRGDRKLLGESQKNSDAYESPFDVDFREQFKQPVSDEYIRESISRILFLSRNETNEYLSMVGILARAYHCDCSRIDNIITDMINEKEIEKNGNKLCLIKEEENMRNKTIRNDIERYLHTYGPKNVRALITLFAAKYSTSKQRIAGNISYMVCKEMTATIISNAPNSVIYC